MYFMLLLSIMLELLVATTYSTLYWSNPIFMHFKLVSLFLLFNSTQRKVEVGWREKVYVVNKRQQSEKRRTGKSMPGKELPNFTFMRIRTHICYDMKIIHILLESWARKVTAKTNNKLSVEKKKNESDKSCFCIFSLFFEFIGS